MTYNLNFQESITYYTNNVDVAVQLLQLMEQLWWDTDAEIRSTLDFNDHKDNYETEEEFNKTRISYIIYAWWLLFEKLLDIQVTLCVDKGLCLNSNCFNLNKNSNFNIRFIIMLAAHSTEYLTLFEHFIKYTKFNYAIYISLQDILSTNNIEACIATLNDIYKL